MNRVSDLERAIDVCTQSIDDLDAAIDETNDANLKLIQGVIKNEEMIANLRGEAEKTLSRLNHGSFIVNGVYLEDNQTPKEAVQDFIIQKLEIKDGLNIQSAHKMGGSVKALIWFRLLDSDDMAIIFKNISKLKGKLDLKGKPFRVREFTLDGRKAQKMRYQDLKMENKRLPVSYQVDMVQKGDSLYIMMKSTKKK